jgi:hypothetical protein
MSWDEITPDDPSSKHLRARQGSDEVSEAETPMTHAATLVCDPAFPVLTRDMLRRASENF